MRNKPGIQTQGSWEISTNSVSPNLTQMSSNKFHPLKDFQSVQIQRSSHNIFTAHYVCRNAKLNLTPVAGTTINGFIFQIINSLIESWVYAWPALTVISFSILVRAGAPVPLKLVTQVHLMRKYFVRTRILLACWSPNSVKTHMLSYETNQTFRSIQI